MPANGGLQDNRITTAHAIYALLIATLSSQVQTKYHDSSPLDTHYGLTNLFVAALLLYGAASVSEVELCARESIYRPVATYSRLFACAVSIVASLFVLELVVLGWIIFSMWAAFFAKAAYDIRFCLHNCLLIVRRVISSKWNNLAERVNISVTKLQPPPSHPSSSDQSITLPVSNHTIVTTGSTNLSM